MSDLDGVIRWGDLPVPYVAAWSSESEISIRVDPVIKAHGVFRNGTRGLGKPLFGKMDESRVRRVVRERKCQVCVGPLGTEGFVFDRQFGLSGRYPIMSEPLACETCFRVAVALCPGIARARGRIRSFGARVRRYHCIASYLQYVDGGDDDLNAALKDWKGPPPVGYLRSALVDYDVIDVSEFQ